MKTLARLAAFVLVLGLLGAAFVWSGAYDVAANRPDAWLDRVAETVADRAVERRAGKVQPPSGLNLDSPALLRTGVVHYQEMCVTCHGGPGVLASDIGMGMSPSPPDLAEEGGEQSPGELFWIIRNGIRMTGMPSFGVTHSDEEVWAIVALVRHLPRLAPQEYQALLREAGASPGAGGDHHHAAEPPPAGSEPGPVTPRR